MAESKTSPIVLLRYKISTDFPYFSSLTFGLILREVPEDSELKTFAVDKYMRMYYNPKMFEVCSPEQLKAIFIHELQHILREHHERGEHFENQKLFNIAGDCEINDDLEANFKGLKLPEWAVFPKNYELPDDKIAEWYYNNLPKGAEGDDGEDEGEQKCNGTCKSGNPKGKPNKNARCTCPHPPKGKESCGSLKGGSWEEGEPTDKTPGHSKVMRDFYRKDTAEKIIEASKSRGDVPAGLVRWAQEHLRNKVDWKKEFRSFVLKKVNETISGMTDYTYQKMSRRQSAFPNVIVPGFHTPIINVAVIQDTSGSMSDTYLAQSVAELNNILKVVRANVTYVSVDAEVGFIGRVTNTTKLPMVGGGGTDMRVGYEALAKEKQKPNLIICMTDGYTPWPEAPIPGVNNCIVVLYEGVQPNVGAPDWAKVLYVDVKE